jgi:hypothetical protein
LQLLTFEKSPKYGFEPGFPLLLQPVQVQKNPCLNFIAGRICSARPFGFCTHDFHKLPQKGVLKAGVPVDRRLQFRGGTFTMTDPATAIKREVFQLIDQQIETLRRAGHLTDSDLDQFRLRSGRISDLYQEHDRIVRSHIAPLRLARAS